MEAEDGGTYELFAPNGSQILGTYDMIPGRAEVSFWTRNVDGELVPEFAGGTEVFWDGQETVEFDGQSVVLAADGTQWLVRECRVVEE